MRISSMGGRFCHFVGGVTFALVAASGVAEAAKVLKVDRSQKMMAVTHGPDRKWRVDDYLCATRQGRVVACGPVIRTTKKGAIVQFDFQTSVPVEAGDRIADQTTKGGTRGAATAHTDERPKKSVVADTTTALKRVENDGSPRQAASAEAPQAPKASPSAVAETTTALTAIERGVPLATLRKPPPPRVPPRVNPRPPQREETRQAKEPQSRGKGNEKTVDLSTLDGKKVPAEAVSSAPIQEVKPEEGQTRLKPVHTLSQGGKPVFRVLYDLLLTYRPGVTPPLTFDNYHSLLMMEFNVSRDIYFGFEVNPTPRFYELDYRISRKMLLRLGRIYIPFDDLSPHSFFGGRANVSKMIIPGGSPFLPDLWTDLGIGMRLMLAERRDTSISLDLYGVNGFPEGGTDPVTPGGPYPDFSGGSGIQDNNTDKSLGARLHGSFFNHSLGLGASAFHGRWTNELDSPGGLWMLGVDGQLRLGGTELRAGYVYTSVELPTDPNGFVRGGLYGELSQRFGGWKLLLRSGEVQNDSRIVAVTDQILVGGTLLYNFGYVELALDCSQDLNAVPGKSSYSYAALRATIGL